MCFKRTGSGWLEFVRTVPQARAQRPPAASSTTPKPVIKEPGSIPKTRMLSSEGAQSSLSPRERAGGEGRCAPCAHTVAPKGLRGSWDKAPHPNPLPEGEGTEASQTQVKKPERP